MFSTGFHFLFEALKARWDFSISEKPFKKRLKIAAGLKSLSSMSQFSVFDTSLFISTKNFVLSKFFISRIFDFSINGFKCYKAKCR